MYQFPAMVVVPIPVLAILGCAGGEGIGDGTGSTAWAGIVSKDETSSGVMALRRIPDGERPGSDATPAQTSGEVLISWEKEFGGPHFDHFSCVRGTRDGCFVAVGSTDATVLFSRRRDDVFVVKVDGEGSLLWKRTFDHDGEIDDAQSVVPLEDGGFLVRVTSRPWGGIGNRIRLIRLDPSGKSIWDKALPLVDHENFGSGCLEPARGGGFLLTAAIEKPSADPYEDMDILLIEVDEKGEISWKEVLGGKARDKANCLWPTRDGGVILAGNSNSYGAGDPDIYLLKTNAAGKEEWHRTFGGPLVDSASSVRQTEDGGYLVTGSIDGALWLGSSYGPGKSDGFILKTDGLGNPIWERRFGGTCDDGIGLAVVEGDGGILALGSTVSFSVGYWDIWLLRTDPSGKLLWQYDLGGPGNDGASGICAASPGSYVMCGSTSGRSKSSWGDAFLLKFVVSSRRSAAPAAAPPPGGGPAGVGRRGA